ncbi:MAG TPA: hypothetical protein VIU62_12180, partial [Chloroflexota bacterium]
RWPTLAVAMPCATVAGACASASVVLFATLLQTRTPEAQRGGIMALWSLAGFGLTPLTYALAGAIGAALSPRGILAAGALSITLSGVIGLASRQMRDAE